MIRKTDRYRNAQVSPTPCLNSRSGTPLRPPDRTSMGDRHMVQEFRTADPDQFEEFAQAAACPTPRLDTLYQLLRFLDGRRRNGVSIPPASGVQ